MPSKSKTHVTGLRRDNRAIARGHDHQHATRILARAWTYIIWRCWQDHLAYDPTSHTALKTLTTQQAA